MTGAERNQVVRRRLAYLDAAIRARYAALPAPGCVLDEYELLCDLAGEAIRRAVWPDEMKPHLVPHRTREVTT